VKRAPFLILAACLIISLILTGCIGVIETPPLRITSPTENQTAPESASPIQPRLPVANLVEAEVVRVIDGDTIEVDIDGNLYKVRYIGIDTPETVHPTKGEEPYGIEASNKNKELVGGKTIRLEKDVSETDKYGRLLRYVYVDDLFVNAELVRLGYAQVSTYPPDVRYQDYFLQLQREAREASRGLWGIVQETPTSMPEPAAEYVGSIKSDKYHYPDCVWAKKILSENQIWFKSVEEAQAQGYKPCGVCKPPTID